MACTTITSNDLSPQHCIKWAKGRLFVLKQKRSKIGSTVELDREVAQVREAMRNAYQNLTG